MNHKIMMALPFKIFLFGVFYLILVLLSLLISTTQPTIVTTIAGAIVEASFIITHLRVAIINLLIINLGILHCKEGIITLIPQPFITLQLRVVREFFWNSQPFSSWFSFLTMSLI